MDLRHSETARLVLRAPRESDLAVVYAIHSDPATNRYNPSGPHTASEQSAAMLQEWIAHWQQHNFGYWAVAAAERPAVVIGFGGVMTKHRDDGSYINLYFRFAPEGWGKGYASEMARAALDASFTQLRLKKVEAIVRPLNRPSIAVIERLGMRCIGTIADAQPPSLQYCIEGHEFV